MVDFQKRRHFRQPPTLIGGKTPRLQLHHPPMGKLWRSLAQPPPYRLARNPLISSHRLETLHSICSDEARLMARKLVMATISHETVLEMKSVFFELMLNVMMRMIAGKRYYGENVVEVEETRRFREILS